MALSATFIPRQICRLAGYKRFGGGAGDLIFDPAQMKGMPAKGEMQAENFVAGLSPGDVDLA